ncbi:hypothetical protein EHE19_014495 [Ruminiclostridium herbifermentans]|uniref:Uncharacterized protein n=1 Tax=Ruminiclostridium herbifermentans TaxID=2488810 RepID=A0A4U7JHC3_9FIRM|nr:DUF6365 family protein [Ruminiclostridium herbifermentans]QNU66082.1 hypothetical protein EHE19_014495 [Ruminiclostridium herbifermentans]
MNKVLIIVLSEISAGELTIGYEFGSRLDKNKCQVKFLVPSKFVSYLQERGQDYISLNINDGAFINKTIVDNLINSYKPDYILLSDIYTIEYSRLWSGVSMQMLKQYAIPILGIDEYEYLSTKCKPDYYGGNFEILPPLLDDCDYVIRNCPLNINRTSQDQKVKCFSLYDRDLELSIERKLEVRKKLGVSECNKMIMYSSSSWESINFHDMPSLGMLMKWLPTILHNYLKDLNVPITLVHVGPNKWDIDINQCGKVTYMNFGYLNPTEFDECLLSSDLFITTNVVSVTLSKAIFGSIPCIVFQNYKNIDFAKLQKTLLKRPEWYQKMAKDIKCVFPFRAGFFGWFRLLEAVLSDNEYTDTYEVVQLFKYDEVLEKLQEYLFNEDKVTVLKEKQKEYISKVLKLTTPQQIIDEIEQERHNK